MQWKRSQQAKKVCIIQAAIHHSIGDVTTCYTLNILQHVPLRFTLAHDCECASMHKFMFRLRTYLLFVVSIRTISPQFTRFAFMCHKK